MNHTHLLGLLLIAVFLLGCQQRPAVPTVALEPTAPVVVIVVTATSQPTLKPTNTTAPTITPLAALTTTVTETITATVSATSVAQATRPPATAAQAQPTEQPTESVPPTLPAPSSFPPPAVLAPEGKAFRDGDTLKFEFASVGPLTADQCYRLDMTLGHPTQAGGVGDYWIGMCGNQSNTGDRLVFEVKPARFRDEANYGTLLVSAENVIPATPEYVMQWFVSVVKLVDATDPVHPNVQPLSPNSSSLQNTFFR